MVVRIMKKKKDNYTVVIIMISKNNTTYTNGSKLLSNAKTTSLYCRLNYSKRKSNRCIGEAIGTQS